jgi:exodeoxyribonuclease VII large subunit
VVRAADRAIRKSTGPLWVRGEVSGWKQSGPGHCYFILKDEKAELACVLWASAARALPMLPENGMQIEVLGQVGIFERRGQFQLDVSRVESTGAGGLWQLAKDRLVRQLRSEGLLDEDRKRPLPFCPERVGIVTSAQSAALHDMHRVLRRRAWWIPVLVSHCSVEGVQAAPEIAAAIARFGLALEECPVDVIVVARGGGSMESLWAFNAECVARAIARAPVPVISAVGHETDYTVADMVADVRAATPTAGAERAVPDGRGIATWVAGFPAESRQRVVRAARRQEERADAAHGMIHRTLAGRLALHDARVGAAAQQLESYSPRRVIERAAERIARVEQDMHATLHRRLRALGRDAEALEADLASTMGRRLDALDRALASEAGALDARSPLRVLARGYALVSDSASGRTVRSSSEVSPRQQLAVRFADGSVRVRVDAPDPGSETLVQDVE